MTPSPESIADWRAREPGVDRDSMRALVAGLPGQIEAAVEGARAFAAGLEAPRRDPVGLVALGMGGSAIAADLVAAYTQDARAVHLVAVRDYRLPRWVDERSIVLASSYSGNTEETLAAYAEAKSRGARAVVVTTGGTLGERARESGDPVLELPTGYPPRAALGWSFAACALVAARLDPALDDSAEADRIADAARFLREVGEGWLDWAPENPALPAAAAAARGVAVVHGGHPVAAAAAYRWKCQLNENAKRPAWHAVLPEHNHNEIVGWEADDAALDRIVPVFLETPWDHPRTRRRFDHVRRLVEQRGAPAHRFLARGRDPLEGMLWLCWLGDCASFLASVIAGRDPSPVHSIDTLKAELAREGA